MNKVGNSVEIMTQAENVALVEFDYFPQYLNIANPKRFYFKSNASTVRFYNRRYNRRYVRSGKDLIPDQHDIKIHSEFVQELYDVLTKLEDRSSTFEEDIYWIIIYIRHELSEVTYFSQIALSISSFLLNRWSLAISQSRSAIRLAQTESEVRLAARVKAAAKTLQFYRRKPFRQVGYVFAPKPETEEIEEMTGIIRKLRKVYGKTMNFFKVRSSALSADANKRSGTRKFDMIFFLGHGSSENGFILKYTDERREYLDKSTYDKYASLLQNNNSLLLILGCEGYNYNSSEYDTANRAFIEDGFTSYLSGVLIYGILAGMERGLTVRDCIDMGFLTLILRSNIATNLKFKWRRQNRK